MRYIKTATTYILSDSALPQQFVQFPHLQMVPGIHDPQMIA